MPAASTAALKALLVLEGCVETAAPISTEEAMTEEDEMVGIIRVS